MHALTLVAGIASLAAVATASTSPAPVPRGMTPVTAPSDISLDKRALCVFGICIGGDDSSSYQSDVNNCGSKGNRCSTSWLWGGGAQCVSGVCAPAYCNSLFDYNWATGKCQDVSSDSNNCGKCGQTCSVSNASGTKCVSGQCYATSCQSGYSLASGTCIKTIDTASDTNNCGSIGNKCPSSYSNGVGSKCASGVCQPQSCNSGFGFDFSTKNGAVGTKCTFPNGSGSCKSGDCTLTSCNSGYQKLDGVCSKLNLQSDPKNCGSAGNVCSFDNGIAKCSSGQCAIDSCEDGYELETSWFLWWSTTSCQKISCNYGFAYDSSTQTCRNVQSDVNNCGSIGNVCPSTNGAARCTAGKCSMGSCNSGLVLLDGLCKTVNLLADVTNCGAVGIVCPSSYANGGKGTCRNGVCETICNSLFDFDQFLGFCRDVSSDTQNCGRCGQKCDLPGALATTCRQGQCYATACKNGYTLKDGRCLDIDTTSDVNNCGSIGRVCQFSPNGATGICKNSQCKTTGCPSGYSLTSGVCIQQTASQRARLAKKDTIKHPKSLCPGANEQATYAQAVEHHFQASSEFSGVMIGAGGYECLDTTQALDSCGGCASTGEGVDCTKIRGSQGVGCEAGKCVVFSCEQGWRPSLRGDRCVRVHATHGHGHAKNATAPAAKRHLAARHHHLHGSSQL
ncbi:hypothetical protein JCM10449v2_001513 [Rhodotorula kratochvilovae]